MTGKLTFENNKWKISFENEKGETKTLFCQPNVFSQGFNPNKEDETEIDFDRDNTPQKNAGKVRPKGQEWQGQEITQTVNYNRQSPISQYQRQDDRNQRNVQNQPRNNSVQILKGEFHNPYNFVPAIGRKTKEEIDIGSNLTGEQKQLAKQLCDDKPSGHDRFISDKLSGKLTVKMTVETPLVVLDTARVEVQGDHKKFPVRVDADGKPFINPTAVKGMLRSAYEAVTNSRMSVFTKHDERLAFRAEVGEGLFVVPARIENEKVFLYTGTSGLPTNSGKPQDGQPMYAAWLGKYKYHGSNYKNFDTNKNEVWAFITKWKHNKFDFWNVAELRDKNIPQPTDFPTDSSRNNSNWHKARKVSPQIGQWVKGFVCKTNHNIKNKHDERVFFVPQGQSPIEAVVKDFEQLKKEWKRLVENYQEEHSDGKGGLENTPKDVPDWSRQIKGGKNEAKLENETLCYAKVKKVGTEFEVLELFPVMISRRLHEVSPNDLLDPSLKPAKLLAQLSPADRVFGWVGDGVRKNGNYRGQVRFGSVICQTADAIQDFDNLPLNILGQPKPQQGRFYVAKDNQGNAQERSSDLTNEKAGYKAGKGLRGRKVYPHHASLPTDYWQNPLDANLTTSNPKFFKEYRRPTKDGQEQRDSQNRSIKGWITAGTEFQFDIHFTNLSEIELGALVWLLSMDEKHFHRFGGGKPLGFGSVKLNLDFTKTEIFNGKELEKRYQSLDDVSMDKTDAETCKTKFKDAMKSAYPNSNFLESFMRACEGFTNTTLPIHYPRARQFREDRDRNVTWLSLESPNPLPPHSEGLAYEWFVANNKNGKQNVLPNISEDTGLPVFDHKKTGG
jgi:CRISPR-associated protein (TIGR03986 family)